jgi:uncharacterized membrane protein
VKLKEAAVTVQYKCMSCDAGIVKVEVVSMSWCRVHSGTCDQILLPVGRLLSESCALVSVGRPL